MKYTMMVFDLDGTLIDSLSSIAYGINKGLEHLGLNTYTDEEYVSLIGNGIPAIADKVLEKESDFNNKELLLNTIRESYTNNYMNLLNIYPDIPMLLDSLVEKGIMIAILTNKEQNIADNMSNTLLSKWKFIEIIGSPLNDEYPRKPSPYGIEYLSKKYKVDKENILFIGDMIVDINTAKNAGIDMIYCNWGIGKLKNEIIPLDTITVDKAEEILWKLK